MATVLPTSRAGTSAAPATAWTTPLWAAALAAVGILVVHAETVASIVAIWIRSETFAHGFVVVPIALWLAWRDRSAIARIPARPAWLALGVVAVAGAAWLAMALADVLGLRQFALLFMVQAAIVAVLGTRIAKAALLPLVFLVFAVPAGEFLLPTMIDWTADFTVWALQVSGVPVYREANHFVIPSGAWSVVEACSGLRYLIASLMIGVVYSAVSYRSRWRKLAFLAASIVVPLVANWLRAYLIVMIGHLSDNTLAVGVDHIIYGWVFFGIVMALLFWVGSFWAEAPATRRARGRTDHRRDPRRRRPERSSAWRWPPSRWPRLPLVMRGVVEHRTAVPVPSLTEIPAPAGYGARGGPEPVGLGTGLPRRNDPAAPGLRTRRDSRRPARGRLREPDEGTRARHLAQRDRARDQRQVARGGPGFRARSLRRARRRRGPNGGERLAQRATSSRGCTGWTGTSRRAGSSRRPARLGALRGESDLSALVAVIAPYRPDAQASAQGDGGAGARRRPRLRSAEAP